MSATQADALNAASLEICRAQAMVDVLAELTSDEVAVEQLDKHSLSTTLSVVRDVLERAQEAVQASFTGKGAEVVNG